MDGYELGFESVSDADVRHVPLDTDQPPLLNTTLKISLRVVEKFEAFVTKGKNLLVFRQVDSEVGVQVIGSTLEPGESPGDGVIRVFPPETGHDSLAICQFLGTQDYEMSFYRLAKLQRRYY